MTAAAAHRRGGYRLATPAEWEWAGRAGADTPFECGQVDDAVLVRHAWYVHNQAAVGPAAQPTGLLKCNPLGLFDLHGNVSEATHPDVRAGREVVTVSAVTSLPMVGGTWNTTHRDLRFTDRPSGGLVENVYVTNGFRLARTLFPPADR
jgi:formylglycine-generating enzyme required for sulfatase activity